MRDSCMETILSRYNIIHNNVELHTTTLLVVCRDELAMEDDIVIRGNRLVIVIFYSHNLNGEDTAAREVALRSLEVDRQGHCDIVRHVSTPTETSSTRVTDTASRPWQINEADLYHLI